VVENGIASRVNVIVRALAIQTDSLVALAAVLPLVTTARASAIDGGITLSKGAFTTTQTSDPAVSFRSALFEGAPITATPGDRLWQLFCTRAHTAVEQLLNRAPPDDLGCLPELAAQRSVVLRPGQNLLVRLVGAVGTSNAALRNNAHLTCAWEEDEIATFAISGTVTLSGTPVAGAIVTILEADDALMTNAVLRQVITTGAGGTWASSIRAGKVGAAFVQYKSGATYYTAPGSPYLS
jgi:hypothetical protein